MKKSSIACMSALNVVKSCHSQYVILFGHAMIFCRLFGRLVLKNVQKGRETLKAINERINETLLLLLVIHE